MASESEKMTVMICVDNRFGMLFNKRRLSRDSAVTADIVTSFADGRLYCSEISRPLFEERAGVVIRKDFLEKAGENDRCFVEDRDIAPYLEKITRIVLYHWNRDYPADFYFDPAVLSRFTKRSVRDLAGTSHETVTKEVYER